MKLKSEAKWLWWDIKAWIEKLEIVAWMALPDRIRHRLVAYQLGTLSTEPVLSGKIIGEITIDDLFRAMRVREDGVIALYDDIWIAPITRECYVSRDKDPGRVPPLDYRRLADCDMAITTDGYVIKDRYGAASRLATPQERERAERFARGEAMWQGAQ